MAAPQPRLSVARASRPRRLASEMGGTVAVACARVSRVTRASECFVGSSRERGRWARGWGHTLTRRPQLGCRCCVSAPHFPRGTVKVTKESCQRLNELIHLKHVEERLPHNNHSINVSNYCNYCHFYPLKTL